MAARLLVALIALAGCAQQAPRVERVTVRVPVEVPMPVPVPCEIEPALLAPVDAALPEFVATCPPASSGLTPEGERKLQSLLALHRQRIEAWRAWAVSCGTTGAEEAPDVGVAPGGREAPDQ